MPREKNRTRGRPSWVSGTKLTFLSKYSDEWQEATDTSLVVAGRFYTRVTKRFIKKYGWHFDRWTDKECPDLDPDTIDDDDDQQGLTDEEISKRSQYYREMRGVSVQPLPQSPSRGIEHMTKFLLPPYSSLWRGTILTIPKLILP